MALNNRYEPSHPQGQSLLYGLDFANILPDGVTINTFGASVSIQTNTVPPQSSNDFGAGLVPQIVSRRMYVQLDGGVSGTDYRVNFQAVDSLGNNLLRTVLLLCAATS